MEFDIFGVNLSFPSTNITRTRKKDQLNKEIKERASGDDQIYSHSQSAREN
jgi:hypothetical protein